MSFRAGDHVHIASIDETWVLACDEENGEIICAGWPESMIASVKCELKRAATDAERREMLRSIARACSDQMRGRRAARQLKAMS